MGCVMNVEEQPLRLWTFGVVPVMSFKLNKCMDCVCPRVSAKSVGMKTMQRMAEESVLTKLVQAYDDEGKAWEILGSWREPNWPACPQCQNAGDKRLERFAKWIERKRLTYHHVSIPLCVC